MATEIARGAEAVISEVAKGISKKRVVKSYRHAELDTKIRKFRTKREAKVIKKLYEAGVAVPAIIEANDVDEIVIEKIDGSILKKLITKENIIEYAQKIGMLIAQTHNQDIVHGDLTTSNMIESDKVYLIDFGLSFFSHTAEDKAVDLHVLYQALDAAHPDVAEQLYDQILAIYKNHATDGENIIKRLAVVEQRGRYKRRK